MDYQEFPKMIYRGGETGTVADKDAEAAQIKDGWSLTPPSAAERAAAAPPPAPAPGAPAVAMPPYAQLAADLDKLSDRVDELSARVDVLDPGSAQTQAPAPQEKADAGHGKGKGK